MRVDSRQEAAAERAARGQVRRTGGTGATPRRHLISIAGAAAAAAAVPPVVARLITDVSAGPGRVTAGDVAVVEQTITDLTARDHQLGGGPIHHMALGELRSAIDLLKGSFLPGVRQRLHRAIANLADLAGWATADVGDITAAGELFTLGLRHARAADDPAMLAHVASGWARVQIQARQPRAALDLVRLARAQARALPAPAVSMLHIVAALAAARLPDPEACRRHIGLAEATFRAPTDDDPDWIGYFTAAKLAGDSGTALFDLTRAAGCPPNPALTGPLAEAVATYPDSRARSKAIAAARLATIHYTLGDVEQANHIASQALALGQQVRSVRLADDLAALAEAAARHRRDPAAEQTVRDAREVLALHATAPTL